MAKPVNLVIKPPYSGWSQLHGFGAINNPTDPAILQNFVMLEKSGTAQVFAAFRGRLSARPPGSNILDPQEDTTPAAASDPLPKTVKLYLHVLPLLPGDNPAFQDALYVHARILNPLPNLASDVTIRIEEITSFVYLNLDPSSLEAGLSGLLPHATTPRGKLSSAKVVEQIVRGTRDVTVPAGHLIGEASHYGAPGGSVHLGLAVLTDWGAHDPSYIYDWLRDFVDEGQPDLDAFLTLVPKSWPILSPLLTKPEAISLTGGALYMWSVLQELKINLQLDSEWDAVSGQPLKSAWRQVGDNQKATWRNRLLRRTGHFTGGGPLPPFEFDDLDSFNLFQLEAVTEYYANFEVSWNAATQQEVATVRDPGSAGYVTVDFLNPSGAAATVSGKVVTLDGEPDLSRVRRYIDDIDVDNKTFSYRDCIYLPAASGNGGKKLYRITDVDDAAKQVTVQADEDLALEGTSSVWEIRLRPFIIIIDSFGGRNLSGDGATVTNGVVTLDGDSNLSKINRKFDTIYLPADTARPSRTYRIDELNADARTLTLQGTPDFGGGTSKWHIPAGISGELPAFEYNLGPGGEAGYDHYDGVIFVVYNGEIRNAPIRWTSYTSRSKSGQGLSSIRGNRVYDFTSFRSTSSYKNYSMCVTDPGVEYDGVRECLYYFPAEVEGDICPPDQIPRDEAKPGKTRIRLHHGETGTPNTQYSGTGSEGCSVSPSYSSVRDLLIEIHQLEYVALHPGSEGDDLIGALYGMDHAASQNFYNSGQLTAGKWDHKILGTLWLIRPDERPLMVE